MLQLCCRLLRQLLIISLFWIGNVFAGPFIEGVHYQKLPLEMRHHVGVINQLRKDAGRVQVLEFFSYACYGCYHLQPAIDKWVQDKPKSVAFYRYPVVFNRHWHILGKAYYLIEKNQKRLQMDQAMFSSIQEKQIRFKEEQDICSVLFSENQRSTTECIEQLHSVQMERQLKWANDIAMAYRITVSPSLIVNGATDSYLLTLSMVNNPEDMIAILKYLVAREQEMLKKLVH